MGDKISKIENNIAKIRAFLMRHAEMRTRDIAEHIGLVVFRTRELLGMMMLLKL
ncbi:FaeA/PapI family transcriptional regulator [Anaerovibrio lipolyticus]|uniref:FaeA/PapI family transcriptional regulator n=1 Tax=Anaerovibrio lipolyticus TaxID=82374 RepID=UPI003AFA67A4